MMSIAVFILLCPFIPLEIHIFFQSPRAFAQAYSSFVRQFWRFWQAIREALHLARRVQSLPQALLYLPDGQGCRSCCLGEDPVCRPRAPRSPELRRALLQVLCRGFPL